MLIVTAEGSPTAAAEQASTHAHTLWGSYVTEAHKCGCAGLQGEGYHYRVQTGVPQEPPTSDSSAVRNQTTELSGRTRHKWNTRGLKPVTRHLQGRCYAPMLT